MELRLLFYLSNRDMFHQLVLGNFYSIVNVMCCQKHLHFWVVVSLCVLRSHNCILLTILASISPNKSIIRLRNKIERYHFKYLLFYLFASRSKIKVSLNTNPTDILNFIDNCFLIDFPNNCITNTCSYFEDTTFHRAYIHIKIAAVSCNRCCGKVLFRILMQSRYAKTTLIA